MPDKSKVVLRYEDGMFAIFAPFDFKDICKSLPTARAKYISEKFYAWVVLATPAVVAEMADAFLGHLDEATLPDQFKIMAEEVRASREVCIEESETAFAPVPHTLRKPWLHQLRGYHLTDRQRATYHAWEMGTGKSKTVVDAVGNLGLSPCLIVCPKQVVDVWPMEFRKHSPLNVHVEALDEGSVAKRAKWLKQAMAIAIARKELFVAVVNYEAAWREPLATLLTSMVWKLIVADEIHKIKAPGGKASRFMAKIGRLAEKRVGLSGTPLPHSPLDAYAQYRFLDPGIFGTSFTAFRNRHARMGGYGNHQVLGFQNMADFNKKFYSIATRVKKSDVLDLPPTLDVERFVKLSPKAMIVYNALATELAVQIEEGTCTASNALVKLLRLQQITGGHIQCDEQEEVAEIDTAKRDALLEYLDDLGADEPVVIFCRFRADLATVEEVAGKLSRGVCELSGRMSARDKEERGLAAWQGGAAPILAAQVQAGGLGVDMTRAAHCAYYSLGFSLGDYLQSRARLDRMGQTRSVTYTHFIATDTVDQIVYKALSKRLEVIESVLEQVKENRHGKSSTDQQ